MNFLKSKKNRIAIVLSLFWLFLAFIGRIVFTLEYFLISGLPVWIYWSYRFIKGDFHS